MAVDPEQEPTLGSKDHSGTTDQEPSGEWRPRRLQCPNCKGEGITVQASGWYGIDGNDYFTCTPCNGSGEVIDPRDRPKPEPQKRWWQR
jgi:DnaJ-class molecular chaperone